MKDNNKHPEEEELLISLNLSNNIFEILIWILMKEKYETTDN